MSVLQEQEREEERDENDGKAWYESMFNGQQKNERGEFFFCFLFQYSQNCKTTQPGKRELHLVHLADQVVDLGLAVTRVTTLDEVQGLLGRVTTGGVGQLEGPQEVGGLLEVGADGVDLVDEILHADNAELAEGLLDDRVVGQGDALLVDLTVSALVDKLADGLQVGLTVGDVGVDELQHLGGGLGQADKDTVVDLEKTQQLEDLAGLGGNVVDTLDADNEGELGLGGNVERTSGLGLTTETDLITLLGAVLTDVLVGALEDDLALGLAGLFLSESVDKVEKRLVFHACREL